MNAAKRIRKYVSEGRDPEQVEVLTRLARALEAGEPFDIRSLYDINMRYFDTAIDLLKDWRFDQHLSARNKLIARITEAQAAEAA